MVQRVTWHERASAPESAYGLSCGRRRLRLSPLAFWGAAAGIVALTLWSAGTAAYFTFRDDLLAGLVARQADMQYRYEDRIAHLRAEVDRLTSRQLLNQEQIEQRIERLVRRQAVLDARARALAGSREAATPAPAAGAHPAEPAKPSPLGEDESPLDRQSHLDAPTAAPPGTVRTHGIPATLARIEESLDEVEARQRSALMAMEDRYDARARRMRRVLVDLGVDPKKIATPEEGGIGGPFVPVPLTTAGNGFERQLSRIQVARAHVDHLARALTTVPVRQPLGGEIETSSPFGVRLDPFLRAPAMHSGLDLRAAAGQPVRATAAGTVVSAGWSGGYGRMVEIDHGNGFSTRYGHLSQILVRPDQAIRPGQIIGRVGSTGRSTGPHLHYETRIDGEPVDPVRFLRAGLRLSENAE